MRLNDRAVSMLAMYRLYIVCHQLRSVKMEGLTMSHNYPRVQLAQMLFLEYWRLKNNVAYQMMDGDIGSLNEEFGEILFSILGRAAAGDPTRSDFQHMDDLYRLLPIYRAVKTEIVDEKRGSQHSLNWHHNIPVDSPEVAATAFFFHRVIRNIANNSYKSYAVTGSKANSAVAAAASCKAQVPVVFNPDMCTELPAVFNDISYSLNGFFLHNHQAQWPEAAPAAYGGHDPMLPVDAAVLEMKVAPPPPVWGSPWIECVEKHFAVARQIDESSNMGRISVYKIVVVNQSYEEGGYTMNTFLGMEYVCTIRNDSSRCVRNGSWNYVRRGAKPVTVNNWHVISYFPSLDGPARRLPASAVSDIDLEHDRDPIFSV